VILTFTLDRQEVITYQVWSKYLQLVFIVKMLTDRHTYNRETGTER